MENTFEILGNIQSYDAKLKDLINEDLKFVGCAVKSVSVYNV